MPGVTIFGNPPLEVIEWTPGKWWVVRRSKGGLTPVSGPFNTRRRAQANVAGSPQENPPKRRAKGTRKRPRKNPPAVGRLISKRVLEIRYKHNDDGKWYKHSFKPGTCAALLANGTVVLYQEDGKPVARDF